jgi:hypothetical protein
MNNSIDNPNFKNMSIYRYEKFFNLYEDENQFKFYNLLKNINIIPANDTSIEEEYIVKPKDTWIYISYKYYNTMDLWWVVCEYNNVIDATKMPEAGTKLKLLKSEYIWFIIQELNKQFNR